MEKTTSLNRTDSRTPFVYKFNNPFAAPDHEEEPQCGMCGWRPTCLQFFSNMKVFMFCFVGLGIFHGMSHSYMGAVLPSIERRFGFSSTKIGTVKAMSDVSHIFAALVVGHYGGPGHRPRWIAAGMFVLGLGMLLFAATEIIFPVRSVSPTSSSNSSTHEELCHAMQQNSTSDLTPRSCSLAELNKDSNTNPLIVFGIAEFLMGLGATTPMILGLPFVDDNVSYRSTPIYFALSFAGRLFGPLLGFGLGAVFNSIYFDFSHPHFQQNDPRWISAWYLGFIVCGLGVCLFAVTIGCFPAALPARKDIKTSKVKENKLATIARPQSMRPKQQPAVTLKDLPVNLKRLLTNSTFIVKLGSQLLEGLVIAGYMSFAQKFIQNQYPVTPATAALAGGVPPVFAGSLGIAIGSFLIKRLKFKPRHVSMMTVGSAIISSACYFSVLAMGCDTPPIVGLDVISSPHTLKTADSDACHIRNDCNCHSKEFSPVCDILSNTSYASPCLAGCVSKKRGNRTTFFLDCSCTANISFPVNEGKSEFPSAGQSPRLDSGVSSGLCWSTCNKFIPYIVVMSIAKLLMGLPLAGVLMIQFRIVDYDLKSMANAVSSIVMSALGFLPAPIIAGFIIDSTCRYWQTSSCSQRGACLLYNVDDFRTKLHVSVGICKLLAALLDCLVTYKMWNLSFDRDEPPSEAIILATEAPLTFDLAKIEGSNLKGSESEVSTPNAAMTDQPVWKITGDAVLGGENIEGLDTVVGNSWTHAGLQKRTSFPMPP